MKCFGSHKCGIMCSVSPIGRWNLIPTIIWPYVFLIKNIYSKPSLLSSPLSSLSDLLLCKTWTHGKEKAGLCHPESTGKSDWSEGLTVWLSWLRSSWSIGTKVNQRSESGKLEMRIKEEDCANTITRSHQREPAWGGMLTNGKLMWELEHRLSAACRLSQAPWSCHPPFYSHLLIIKAPLQATAWLNLYLAGNVSRSVSFFLRDKLKGCQK